MFNSKNMLSFFIFLFAINSCYSVCLTPVSDFKNILVLKNNKILYPNDGNVNIRNNKGGSITLACPGSKIKTNNLNIEQADFTCKENDIYTYETVEYHIGTVTCADTIYPVEKDMGRCLNGHSLLHIGFQFNERRLFLPHIELCWDNTRKATFYTYAILEKQLGGCPAQSSISSFRSGKYFPSSLEKWYTKHGQVYNLCNTFPHLLQEIEVFDNLLEIGHLVAKCDFVYDVQQRLTYQYTNAAPQWKSFNGGNWKLLEIQIRNMVAADNTNLDIYTGTYSNLLVGGNNYYLNNGNNEVAVPQYFWKVIIKKESSTSTLGIAIIGMNNILNYNPINDPCPDILNQVNWLRLLKAKTVRNGYIIACDVKDFVKINGLNTQLPDFPIITGKLLGKTPAG